MSEKEYDRTATMDKCWRCGSTGNCCGRQDNPSLLALLAEKDAEIERLTGVIALDCKIMEESSDKLKAAEQKVAIAEKGLKEIISNDSRSHFNRVDAMTLTLWARETLNKLKAVK